MHMLSPHSLGRQMNQHVGHGNGSEQETWLSEVDPHG